MTKSLLGTLNHCTLIVPLGKSFLPMLTTFTALFHHLDNVHTYYSPPSHVTNNLAWWQLALSTLHSYLYYLAPTNSILVHIRQYLHIMGYRCHCQQST